MEVEVFQFVGISIKNASDAFLYPAVVQLSTGLSGLALTGVSLHFVLMGYMIITGAVQESFFTLTKQCLKVIIISAFAFSVGNYMNFVVGSFNGLESGLSAYLNPGGPINASIYQTIDSSFNRGLDLVIKCFDNASEASILNSAGAVFAWIVTGITIALGTLLLAALGGANIIVAKFSLTIILALGPLFIMCLMWPVTARFFDSWFSQAMTYVLTIVIMAVIMTLALRAFDVFVSNANFEGGDVVNPIKAACQIGALTTVLLWIILQSGTMASGLAGGMSSAALQLRHLLSPIEGAKWLVKRANPVSARRDLRSGRIEHMTRLQHLTAGNTVLNPAYRQGMWENLGRNWGRKRGGKVSNG